MLKLFNIDITREPPAFAGGDLFGFFAPPSPPTYPDSPGWRGEEGGTSHAAAEKIAPTVTGLRKRTLDAITELGTPTADEVAAHVGRTPFSIRPRVAELHALDLIEPAAERGKNESRHTANRWQIKPKATA